MDDLDALLTPLDPPPGDGRLREQVRRLTSRGLRRRRIVRRAALVAAVAVVYAAGLGTACLVLPRPHSGQQVMVGQVDRPVEPPSSVEESSPLALEWQAFESDRPRPDLYRRAGDLHLAANDVAAALRCYRSALRLGDEADLEFNANDSWLLMTLKAERREGGHDAGNRS